MKISVVCHPEDKTEVFGWLKQSGAKVLNTQKQKNGTIVYMCETKRRRAGRPRKLDREKIVELRDAKMTFRAIAKEMHCTPGAVHHIIDQIKISKMDREG